MLENLLIKLYHFGPSFTHSWTVSLLAKTTFPTGIACLSTKQQRVKMVAENNGLVKGGGRSTKHLSELTQNLVKAIVL